MSGRMVRVLLAKFGEGYEEDLWRMARNIRDAGEEAIYTDSQKPEVIVGSAIQESADYIAIAVSPGTDLSLFGRVMEVLRENEATDILVSAGGEMTEEDQSHLKKSGIRSFFPIGGAHDDLVRWIRGHFTDPLNRRIAPGETGEPS